jgi:hypothetical protein
MSNETNNAAPSPPRSPASPVVIFQIVKDNFAVASGLVVIVGVGLATLFLYSYLGIFGWHLIWFVQYSDILAFGIIGVGIICGAFIFLQAVVQTSLDISSFSDKSKRRWMIGCCGLASLGLIAFYVNEAFRQQQGYFHVLFGAMALALGVSLIFVAVDYVRVGMWPNAAQTIFALILIITSTASAGMWLAYSVLETSGFDQDVTLKDETLSSAKLIIVMSRHTILLKDKVLYVVPTVDISQFRTASKH